MTGGIPLKTLNLLTIRPCHPYTHLNSRFFAFLHKDHAE